MNRGGKPMNVVTAAVRHTPEDLLTMPDADAYELVDGYLVERKMGAWASYVAGEVYGILRDHNRAHRLGWVFPEGTSYQCFPDNPDKVRRADASFILLNRL